MAKIGTKKRKVRKKEMRFSNDPMVRFYDRAQEWLQESGRPVVIAIAVVVGIVLVYTIGSYFFSYRASNAEKGLAAALEIYNAPVVDTPPVNSTAKFYTDEKIKWQDAADAFGKLASDHSSYYGVLGHYYEGCADLHLDNAREKGVKLLEDVANKNEQPTSDLARMALAQNYVATGNPTKAIEYYQKLTTSKFLPKQAIDLGLGNAYEKAGDNQKAVEAYFDAAQIDRNSGVGSEAEKRLTALAPDKLKDLPAPTTPGS